MNILSTTHLKQYNMFLNSQYGPDVLMIPDLPSQASGVGGSCTKCMVRVVTLPYISILGSKRRRYAQTMWMIA